MFLIIGYLYFAWWTWSAQVWVGNWLYSYHPKSKLRWIWWSMDEMIYGFPIMLEINKIKKSVEYRKKL